MNCKVWKAQQPLCCTIKWLKTEFKGTQRRETDKIGISLTSFSVLFHKPANCILMYLEALLLLYNLQINFYSLCNQEHKKQQVQPWQIARLNFFSPTEEHILLEHVETPLISGTFSISIFTAPNGLSLCCMNIVFLPSRICWSLSVSVYLSACELHSLSSWFVLEPGHGRNQVPCNNDETFLPQQGSLLGRFVIGCVAWKQHCFSIGVRRTDFLERANTQMSNNSVCTPFSVFSYKSDHWCR